MQNYTVKQGDTLGQIAQQNGMTLQQLLTLNPQFQSNPNMIRPGQAVNLSSSAAPVAETQASVDAKYAAAAAKNPAVASLTKGGSSIDQIVNALSTGNLSSITDSMGMPFSVEDQQNALHQANEDTKLYYDALKAKETADAESALAQKQADYQDYLIKSGNNFQTDRTNMNQTAVNNGVLFSGSNAQKQRKLQASYEQDQASKLGSYSRDVGSLASNYQYKNGNDAAQGLNKYYSAGGNTYGLGTATGTVGSTGLSSIYNPSQYNYQGTNNTARSAAANTRAAGLLWNKGNKLLSTGYSNQY